MPARDIFHKAVRNALEKDGWKVTDDPLLIEYGKQDLYIDLGAEKLIAAEKSGRRIAVEIKTFIGPSLITSFYAAVGQFVAYQTALESTHSDRTLFLAVPVDIYRRFFLEPLVSAVVAREAIKLITFDEQQENIEQWIE